MNKYEIIFESLQEKVTSGELTIEQAEELNDTAYQKYVVEGTEECHIDEAVVDSIINGDITFEEAADIIEESGNDNINANEVYKKALRDASTDFNDSIRSIKQSIKQKQFTKAKAEVITGKITLKRMKSLVEKTPSNISDDAISQCSKIIGTGLSAEIMYRLIGEINDTNYNGIGLMSGAVSTADSLLKWKRGKGMNVYKQKALKAINTQFVALNKVEKKLEKAIEKSKK